MSDRGARYRAIIGRALTTAIHNDLQPPVVDEFDYGAIWIDPGLLTLKYMFADEAALEEAERIGVCDTIKQRVFQALAREGYPKNAIARVHVGFASQEEVRDAGGPWNYFR